MFHRLLDYTLQSSRFMRCRGLLHSTKDGVLYRDKNMYIINQPNTPNSNQPITADDDQNVLRRLIQIAMKIRPHQRGPILSANYSYYYSLLYYSYIIQVAVHALRFVLLDAEENNSENLDRLSRKGGKKQISNGKPL